MDTAEGIMIDPRKFDPKKLAKLNDPKRLEYLDPDAIWEKTRLADAGVLIDIGAGTALFAVLFAKKIKSGKVYACDISEEMIAWMNDNIPAEMKSIVIPVKMEENSVPLADGIADLVYMINLHHELEQPLKLLKEVRRLLKKDGKLMIIDWKKEETPEGPPLEIRITAEAIQSQMSESGFSDTDKYTVLPYHNFFIGEKTNED